jgi:hypothetical protein
VREREYTGYAGLHMECWGALCSSNESSPLAYEENPSPFNLAWQRTAATHSLSSRTRSKGKYTKKKTVVAMQRTHQPRHA